METEGIKKLEEVKDFVLGIAGGGKALDDEKPSFIEEKGIDFGDKEVPMISDDDYGAIQALKRQGVKKKKAARILGLDVKTVKKYWKEGKHPVYQREKIKPTKLDPYRDYLLRRAPETDYCAWVCFLDIHKKGYTGGYTAVKDLIRPLREEDRRFREATIRFETLPGKQAQLDWGSTHALIGGAAMRIELFVMVLGYSRRIYVRAEQDQKLPALIHCHEQAFRWFGGLTEAMLYDNPKTICLKRDFEGKHITWNPQFLDFARYYGFETRLCKPYRARTKGKVEAGVKYVKRNFFSLYGRAFQSFEELNEKLEAWALEIADERIHGTTHEKPSVRFKDERLRSLEGKTPYRIEIDSARIVPSDALVVFKTNRYSVPWRCTGKEVALEECGERLKICHAGVVIADHPILAGRYEQHIIPGHYEGLPRPTHPKVCEETAVEVSLWPYFTEDVEIRDLGTYEALASGGVS